MFTTEFLQQEGMDLYFEKQTSGEAKGEIWATNYFFKACYNDIGNLWLLSVGANSSKSAKDVVDYLKEIFGDSFKDDVAAHGSVQRGLIVSKIGGAPITTIPGLGGHDVTIYSGGQGIGQFITDWHGINRNFCFQIMKEYEVAYQTIDEKLDTIVQLFAEGKDQQAKKHIIDLKRAITSMSKVVDSHERPGFLSSSSEEDTTYDRQRRERGTVKSYTDNQTKSSLFKKIESKIAKTYFAGDPNPREALAKHLKLSDHVDIDKLTVNEMIKLKKLVESRLANPDPSKQPELPMLLLSIKDWARPEVHVIQEKLSKLEMEILELKVKLEEADIAIQQKEDSVLKLEDELTHAQAEIQEKTDALKDAEEAKQALSAKLKVAEETKQDLNTKLKAAEEAKQETSEKLQAATETNQELNAKLKAADEAKQELSTKLEAATDTNQDLSAKLKVADEAKQELSTKLEAATDTNQDLSAKTEGGR